MIETTQPPTIHSLYKSWLRVDSPGGKVEVLVDALYGFAAGANIDWDDDAVDTIESVLILPGVLEAVGSLIEDAFTRKSKHDKAMAVVGDNMPRVVPTGLVIQIILALIEWLKVRNREVPGELWDRIGRLQKDDEGV